VIVDLNDRWAPWFAWYPVRCLDDWTDVQHPEVSVRTFRWRWRWLTRVYRLRRTVRTGDVTTEWVTEYITIPLWLKAHIIYG
jgi:hypothetical protein